MYQNIVPNSSQRRTNTVYQTFAMMQHIACRNGPGCTKPACPFAHGTKVLPRRCKAYAIDCPNAKVGKLCPRLHVSSSAYAQYKLLWNYDVCPECIAPEENKEVVENEDDDLQRAISLSIASYEKEWSARSTSAVPDSDETECIVCLEQERTHVFTPCGHFMFCDKCAMKFKTCPVCQLPVESTMRVFR